MESDAEEEEILEEREAAPLRIRIPGARHRGAPSAAAAAALSITQSISSHHFAYHNSIVGHLGEDCVVI